MVQKEQLLERLDEIGASLQETGQALALLGLGSVGVELERLDEYSDLDFFVVAKNGWKDKFIGKLDWLERISPLAYAFKNADVGYKFLYEDGVYGEFAVFDESEMTEIFYPEGRIVWTAPGYSNPSIAKPVKESPAKSKPDLDFSMNEALTNLYVGLCRHARGERLSAMRFIGQYAVDHLILTLPLHDTEVSYYPDPFSSDRRIEVRYPRFAALLENMLQGYGKAPQSAIAVLNYIESIYPATNKPLASAIRDLAEQLGGGQN